MRNVCVFLCVVGFVRENLAATHKHTHTHTETQCWNDRVFFLVRVSGSKIEHKFGRLAEPRVHAAREFNISNFKLENFVVFLRTTSQYHQEDGVSNI